MFFIIFELALVNVTISTLFFTDAVQLIVDPESDLLGIISKDFFAIAFLLV